MLRPPFRGNQAIMVCKIAPMVCSRILSHQSPTSNIQTLVGCIKNKCAFYNSNSKKRMETMKDRRLTNFRYSDSKKRNTVSNSHKKLCL